MENSVNEEKEQILNFAHMFLNSGDWDEALAQCNKILAVTPDDMDAQEILGDTYFKKKSINSAYESYSKLISTFLASGQSGKAILVFKKMIELDPSKLPESAQAQINYAHGYIKIDQTLEENKIEPAIELIGKILKFRPEDLMVRTQLVALDNKIDEMPVSIQTYQTLGDAFFKNNMLEKARQMFTKITEIDPQNPAVRLHLAQVYLKQGAISEAKKEYLNLAEDSYAKGRLDIAFESAQKAIELKSVEAHYVSGLIYFKRQKFEEAITEFERLLRFKVNHLGALIHLGKCLDMLGRLEKARATFQKALETDNENPEVQEAWIEFCVRIKEIDKAIPNMTTILEKAVTGNNAELVAKFSKLMLRLEPDIASTHVKLIEALQTLGDLDGAADALYRFALFHERKKQYGEAVQCLEKAIVLNPANTPMLEKALTRLSQKELKNKYGASFETENPIIFNSSDFWGGSDPKEFINDFNESVSLDAIDNPISLAEICSQKGFLKAAIEIYQQILETNPSSEEARKNLAEVSGLYLKKLTGSK
jgi:tetratricopeptide (TPR) repeat protein